MRLINANDIPWDMEGVGFIPVVTKEEIDNMPTIEAEPVKHGKWVHDGYDIPHGVDWMHCSECGNRESYVPAAMTNYCPKCGAKMDAERKE